MLRFLCGCGEVKVKTRAMEEAVDRRQGLINERKEAFKRVERYQEEGDHEVEEVMGRIMAEEEGSE